MANTKFSVRPELTPHTTARSYFLLLTTKLVKRLFASRAFCSLARKQPNSLISNNIRINYIVCSLSA